LPSGNAFAASSSSILKKINETKAILQKRLKMNEKSQKDPIFVVIINPQLGSVRTIGNDHDFNCFCGKKSYNGLIRNTLSKGLTD
jgi:hypothetical protein